MIEAVDREYYEGLRLEIEQLTRAIARIDEAIQPVIAAEKMALAGSHEHGEYVKAALASAWPTIRACAQMRLTRRSCA